MTRGQRRNDDGATAVEFAFIVLPFMLFVFGAVDYGMFEFQQSQNNAGARDGERVAVLYAGLTGGDAKVTAAATQRLGVAKNTVNVSTTCTSGVTGNSIACSTVVPGQDRVTVTVTSTYKPLTPVLGQILGTRTIVSSSTQVVSGLPQ